MALQKPYIFTFLFLLLLLGQLTFLSEEMNIFAIKIPTLGKNKESHCLLQCIDTRFGILVIRRTGLASSAPGPGVCYTTHVPHATPFLLRLRGSGPEIMLINFWHRMSNCVLGIQSLCCYTGYCTSGFVGSVVTCSYIFMYQVLP